MAKITSAHLNGNDRTCSGTTIVSGQSKVFVNGELWAVEGDLCSHGAGALIADYGNGKVRINDKKVIVVGAGSAADNFSPPHLPPLPRPKGGGTKVFGYSKTTGAGT
jgi:uncharacterized Zn-binding protein involved in type VI secretion